MEIKPLPPAVILTSLLAGLTITGVFYRLRTNKARLVNKERKLQSKSDSATEIVRDPHSTAYVRVPVQSLPELQNDLMLRAFRGEKTERIPAWMMRQAGRYLPEFRALRVEHDFFEVCRDPELACTVTIQPLERFGPVLLSACIIFSDILVVLQALQIEVKMVPKVGPVIPHRLESPSSPEFLKVGLPVDVRHELGYVYDALNLTRLRLQGQVPLIGFSGAPFTLMGYWIEGGGSRTLSKAKRWLYDWPVESHKVLQKICDVVVEYLVLQVTEGGAQALQVFESNGGDLAPAHWHEFCFPYLAQIATRVKAKLREAGVSPLPPMIVFSRGSNWEGSLETLAAKTEYDCIGLDWTIDPKAARARVPGKTLQGNLCPAALYASPQVIKRQVDEMVAGFHSSNPGAGYVANLGHGMEPEMDPEHARAFLEAIKNARV